MRRSKGEVGIAKAVEQVRRTEQSTHDKVDSLQKEVKALHEYPSTVAIAPAFGRAATQYIPGTALRAQRRQNGRLRPINARAPTGRRTNDPDAVDPYEPLSYTYGRETKHWSQATAGNLRAVLSAWDLFTLNRFVPGVCDSPYVNNMTVTPIPTGVFHNSFSLASCYDTVTQANQGLGLRRYTIMMYCPSLSAWAGSTGTAGQFSATTRLGGMIMVQTNDLNTVFSNADWTRVGIGSTAIGLYGSDFTTFASGGSVWAGCLHLRLVCAAANLVGAVYKGVMTFNQLGAAPTLNNLMMNAQYNGTGTYDTTLKSSVVQPAVIEDISYAIQTADARGSGYQGADNELVSYLIYQDPVVSINTGATTFTLLCNQEGNYAYYPKTTDPLAFSLGQPAQKPVVDEVLAKHPEIAREISPLVNTVVEDTTGYKGIWSHAKSALSSFLTGADSASDGLITKIDGMTGGHLKDKVGLGAHSSGLFSGLAKAAGQVLGKGVLGIASPITSIVSSLFVARHNGPVYYGRTELLWTATQSRDVLRRQVNMPFMYGFQSLLDWYDEYIDWLYSQPDLILSTVEGPIPPIARDPVPTDTTHSDCLESK